jgi:hypothetical protein
MKIDPVAMDSSNGARSAIASIAQLAGYSGLELVAKLVDGSIRPIVLRKGRKRLPI